MTLTWKEFLNLAAVVQKLDNVCFNFDKKSDIKEFNRQVAEAAHKYLNLLKDAKYMEFTKSMRIGKSIHKLKFFIEYCVLNFIYR